ncbi:SAM hydrolase/SAM-dependent halogenase family protein [Leuconostoc falkenbergense]|uniref:SAM hydrolase/SAM-dependent halogenase family protein n=1 Tax=Leuconostoc falkenbergense TaxID=2766470 RepID=UPI0019686B0F|nr:SAM-dependent chlorinase/fluorinase [Leuconostoc falkenbergense]QSB51909.1 SAM-dependent chlorinase/fluorinase [Leuconostoc falkenbergense]
MISRHLVLQTDFGLQDGAVSSMRGVAYGVADNIVVSDLTHGITPFNIFEGSFRLFQTFRDWQAGTVFVSVVDPGVGSNRLSIIAKTKTGHYIVTPDNGTLSHLLTNGLIESARVIDETTQRLPGSEKSATFHGRDIYAFNGAKLASGQTQFEDYRQSVSVDDLVRLPITPGRYQETQYEQPQLVGNIDITDVNFGSLWSNIPISEFEKLNLVYGDTLRVQITHHDHVLFDEVLPYVNTFTDVNPGEPLIYIDSVYTVAFGVHTVSFEQTYHVGAGQNWAVVLTKEAQ